MNTTHRIKTYYFILIKLLVITIGSIIVNIHGKKAQKSSKVSSIDLTPFLEKSTIEALQEVGVKPFFVAISPKRLKKIYHYWDECVDIYSEKIEKLLPKWEKEFARSPEGIPWFQHRFGYRDKRSTGKYRCYLQVSLPYIDWIFSFKKRELASIPPLEALFYEMKAIEKLCQQEFQEKLTEIAGNHPSLARLYYYYRSNYRFCINLRIISYEEHDKWALPPHYDKGAATIIFSSDDPASQQALILSPYKDYFSIYDLNRIQLPLPHSGNDSTALFITGAMLERLGIPIRPVPHGVLPHLQKRRHVLVASCHTPFLNVKAIDYTLVKNIELTNEVYERFPEYFEALETECELEE